jgi:CsoR family transcriptional regulator, copper-sensing transcriptional repressor
VGAAELASNNGTVATDLRRRLRFIEGQARGVQGMVEDDREWSEILTQLLAIESAARAAANLVVRDQLLGRIKDSVSRVVLSCMGECEFCDELNEVMRALDELDHASLVADLPLAGLAHGPKSTGTRKGVNAK